jgi:hypothetical protein
MFAIRLCSIIDIIFSIKREGFLNLPCMNGRLQEEINSCPSMFMSLPYIQKMNVSRNAAFLKLFKAAQRSPFRFALDVAIPFTGQSQLLALLWHHHQRQILGKSWKQDCAKD